MCFIDLIQHVGCSGVCVWTSARNSHWNEPAITTHERQTTINYISSSDVVVGCFPMTQTVGSIPLTRKLNLQICPSSFMSYSMVV